MAAAAARPQAMATVARLYAELADAVSHRKPACDASGRCCRFEAYGHRMYVSTIELARFVTDLAELADGTSAAPWDGTGCPFQVDKLCGVHTVRPLGCRTFFCDPTSTEWQNALYERHHHELRNLHDTLGVPYLYVEWRQALRELGLAALDGGGGGDRVRLASLTVSGRPIGH